MADAQDLRKGGFLPSGSAGSAQWPAVCRAAPVRGLAIGITLGAPLAGLGSPCFQALHFGAGVGPHPNILAVHQPIPLDVVNSAGVRLTSASLGDAYTGTQATLVGMGGGGRGKGQEQQEEGAGHTGISKGEGLAGGSPAAG